MGISLANNLERALSEALLREEELEGKLKTIQIERRALKIKNKWLEDQIISAICFLNNRKLQDARTILERALKGE